MAQSKLEIQYTMEGGLQVWPVCRERQKEIYTYTGMRQCIPTDTVSHYKQNGDPNGMINSTEIRPVL